MGYRKFLSILTVALFLIMAALPTYGMLIPALNGETGENRALAQWPGSFEPAAIEAWFDDHFALRGQLTQIYNSFNAKAGVEILNGVAIGKDGWLYYMYDGSQEDIRREIHYSDYELAAICEAQQAAADYLESQGISYYLMVCPDKHTVYPEYLPDGLSGYEGDSRFDGLCAALTENTTVNLIDTRQAVIDAKGDGQLFFKTDTHWNALGAYVGYAELMERIARDHPNVRIVSKDECTLTSEEWHDGDMAEFIGQSDVLSDTLYTWSVNGSTARLVETPYAQTSDDPTRPILCYENPDRPELPTAVIFRDSFMGRDASCTLMLPLIADSFSRVTIVWSTSVLEHIVANEEPDIVVMEYVERYSGNAAQGMNVPEAGIVEYVTGETDLPKETFSIFSCVDSLDTDNQICVVSGWAFLMDRQSVKGSLHVGLKCGDEVVWCDTSSVDRPDVSYAYAESSGGLDLNASGFYATFDKAALHEGKWELIIAIDDGESEPVYGELGKRVRIN